MRLQLITFILVTLNTLIVYGDDSSDKALRVNRKLHKHGVVIRGFDIEIPKTAVIADDDLADVADLGRITFLRCYSKTITSSGLIHLLSSLKGLQYIILEGPGVNDEVIDALGQHAMSLRFVSLSGPFHGHHLGSLQGMGSMHSLETLQLRCKPVPPKGASFGETFGLTNQAVTHIAELGGLRTLSLQGCGITDENAARLSSLRDLIALELDGNPISGSGLSQLQTLTRLERLTLSSCRLTDEGIAQFPHLPSLQLLRLSDNQLGDKAIEAISSADLDELNLLLLDRTDVTDRALADIATLKTVKDLTLSQTRIEGKGLSQLHSLPLRTLDLSWTRFSDRHVKNVHELRQLRTLAAAHTQLTDQAIPSLIKLERLEYLGLKGTEITASGLELISNTLVDCEIETQGKLQLVPDFQLIPGGILPTHRDDDLPPQ